MLPSLATLAIIDDPFPHAVIKNVFSDELFARLHASYPECPPASGPTGHTIHRGDPEFAAVMAAHPEWQKLFAQCNAQPFVAELAELFAAEIARSCQVRTDSLRFVDHIESRQEKESARTANAALAQSDMFARFDFMQGKESYSRQAHLDHRRRLATMLIYFDAPGPETYQGGELILHDASGNPVRRIAPAPNSAVLFPCSERSWHSVGAVTHCRDARRFMQISISSCHAIWPSAKLPAKGWADRLRRLSRFARA